MEAVREIDSGRQQPLWHRRDSEPGPEVGDTPGGKGSRGVSGAETLRRAVLAAAILCLVIQPVAVGQGRALFEDLSAPLRLSLVEARSFECGVVVHIYRPQSR
jgi:hypothetical protein